MSPGRVRYGLEDLILNKHLVRPLLGALVLLATLSAQAQSLSMWKVTGEHAEVYLLGSIHALRGEMYPLPEIIESTFDDADKIVFEVDLNKVTRGQIANVVQNRGIYPPGESIRSDLTPATLALLDEYLDRRRVDFDSVAMMRPWFLSINVGVRELQSLGYTPSNGIDQHFLSRAEEEGKEVHQLETFEAQIDLVASDPLPLQDLSLRLALEQIDVAGEQIETLVAAWREGDANLMYRLSLEETARYPELAAQNDRVILNRNHDMARGIREYVNGQGVTMVIVGALHMGGEDGILALLEKDFPVTQLSR